MAEVVPLRQKPEEPLRCPGIGRDAQNPNALVIYLDRPASDDEMRFLHDVLKRAVAMTGGEK